MRSKYGLGAAGIGKPIDATTLVPGNWDPKNEGYVFDFGAMWGQHKTTLPLVRLLYQGWVAVARINDHFANEICRDKINSTRPCTKGIKKHAA